MMLAESLSYGDRPQLARRLGISLSFLHQICTGRRRPSVDLARRISTATSGEVTVQELLLGGTPLNPLERWSPNDPETTADDVLRSMGIQPPAPPPPPKPAAYARPDRPWKP